MLLLSDRKSLIETIDVRKKKEITVRVRNEPGVLARLFATVASCGGGILACSSYSNGEWAVVLLVTEHPARTEGALEEGGFEYDTDFVVIVDPLEQLGNAMPLTAQLRDAGIGILYSYTWWSESLQARAVFKTQDDDRAIQVLQDYLAPASNNRIDGISSSRPGRVDLNASTVGRRRATNHAGHTQRH
jgi:hypothetical protein